MLLVSLEDASIARGALLLNRLPSSADDLLDFNLNFYRFVVHGAIDYGSNHELRLSIRLLLHVHLVGILWIDSHAKWSEIHIFPALVLRPMQVFQYLFVFVF